MVLHSKNIEKNVSLNKKSVENKIRKIKNYAISALLAIVASAFLVIPSVALGANDAVVVPVSGAVAITFDSHKPIVLKDNKPEIVPGESVDQKKKRVAAEKKAKEEAKKSVYAQRTISVTHRVYADPSNFDAIYKRAEKAFGVDAMLLRAVHYVETGCSGSTYKTSYAGATGPMQFLPSTFRHYGVDGNGDGIVDISNVEDAIFTAAKYLKACGYPDVKRALWGYNRSTSYYYKVMEVANSLGFNG